MLQLSFADHTMHSDSSRTDALAGAVSAIVIDLVLMLGIILLAISIIKQCRIQRTRTGKPAVFI